MSSMRVTFQAAGVLACIAAGAKTDFYGTRANVWGDARDGERKARVLKALLQVEGDTYDVSVAEVAVVR